MENTDYLTTNEIPVQSTLDFKEAVSSYLQTVNSKPPDGLDFIKRMSTQLEPNDYEHKQIKGAGWKNLFNQIITKNIPNVIQEEYAKYELKENVDLFKTKKMEKQSDIYYQQLDVSNHESETMKLSRRDIEDLYMEFGYHRRKRIMNQQRVKPKSFREDNSYRILYQIEKEKQKANQFKNIIEKNKGMIKSASSRNALVTKTLQERTFSKTQLQKQLGSSLSKKVIYVKAQQVSQDQQIRSQSLNKISYRDLIQKTLHNASSIKTLTNATIIKNPDPNFQLALKTKLHKRQQINITLNKSKTYAPANRKMTLLFQNKPQNTSPCPQEILKIPTLSNYQKSIPSRFDTMLPRNQDKNRQLEQLRKINLKEVETFKKSYKENYLSNVLRNVKEEFFKNSRGSLEKSYDYLPSTRNNSAKKDI